MCDRRTRKTSLRPVFDDLDPRLLLSTAGMTLPPVQVSPMNAVLNQSTPLLTQLTSTPKQVISTVPSNGDVNPYGVAFVPKGFAKGGVLQPGDILVANFNNSQNLQGTGTTILRVTPNGQTSTFFQGQPGLGLDTGLGFLQRGFVIVGNLPTVVGTSATIRQGSLLILDKNGHQVATLSSKALLNGPWDLTIDDHGSTASVFVSNVLSGTVTRIDLSIPSSGNHIVVKNAVQIASGYAHRLDPASLVLGPAGLAYDDEHDTLYVASSLDNAIFAIPNAESSRGDHGTGRLVVQDNVHLHGPLGLVLAPNGNLIVANADGVNTDPNQPSEIAEFTTKGKFLAQISLNAMPAAPFGIALQTTGDTVTLAAVNDDTNQLEIFSAPIRRNR
jgi:hypothetical protein